MFFVVWCVVSMLPLTFYASNIKKIFDKNGYKLVHSHEQLLTPKEQAKQTHKKNTFLLTRALSQAAIPTQTELDQAIAETNSALNILPQESPKKELLRKQFQALASLSRKQSELIDQKK